MTTAKAKAGYLIVGALLTLFILYPTLKETRREQPQGLLLSPEEVKAACGKPQVDDLFKLTYVENDRNLELQFMGWNHKMYLSDVKWGSSNSSGHIPRVSTDAISDYVTRGALPTCLGELAR